MPNNKHLLGVYNDLCYTIFYLRINPGSRLENVNIYKGVMSMFSSRIRTT